MYNSITRRSHWSDWTGLCLTPDAKLGGENRGIFSEGGPILTLVN